MAKIIIIDGNSLLFRGYYATAAINPDKIMRTSTGVPTNAIFAFANMITALLKSLNKDDGIFVAFDSGKHTFRHKEYKDYKANRAPCPEDLLIQMPLARELLDNLNIVHYENEEIEADDIAGIMAKKAESLGYDVLIYTSDRDYLQLIDDKITIKLIKRGLKDIKDMTPATFMDEWGFEPKQIVDYKGLMGDASDNLKGIPKVGDTTAKNLIKTYGTVENVIANADSIKGKLGENIKEFQDLGLMCKKLAIIRTEDTINIPIDSLIYKGYNFNKIIDFSKQYELKTLIDKLPPKLRISSEISKVSYENVENFNEINIGNQIGIGVDASDENYHDAELFGLLITIEDKVYKIELSNIKTDEKLLNALKDTNVEKYAFDFKKIKYLLNKNGIEINGLAFDLSLASYLIDSSIKQDIIAVLAYEGIDASYALNNNSLFDISNPLLSAVESYFSLKLADQFISKLKEKDQYDLLIKIEQPLTLVLCDMEREGFPVNKEYLVNLGKTYKQNLDVLTKEIYDLAGEEFNIASPKQLASILYEKLKLKGNRSNSTSVEHLNELRFDHPIIEKVLEYRKYAKLLNTYVEGYLSYIKEDGKIHATFNQALTTTGRLSSSEPNLQNIAIRDEESKLLRKAFYYEDKDTYILSLDYSQIELRMLAHLSKCKSFIDAFNNNEDIHMETAKKVFPGQEITSSLRRKAKAVNFGIVYGISDWGLSEQLEVPVIEARQIITDFYTAFPEVREYLDSLVQFAISNGYATTMFNRRRYLPEINSDQYQVREFAKRAAMNAPIQGSASDLIKIAMIEVDKALKEKGYRSKIISQIHDEIIIKTFEDEKDDVLKLVKNIMENCVKLDTKLEADGGYAHTWYDAK